MSIGYSHALFGDPNADGFRKLVEDADKIENGGNNNGLLDGNEKNVFKQYVRQKFNGYEFDFSNISQSTKKTVRIKDKQGNYIYHSHGELANGIKYKNGKRITGYADNGINSKSTTYLTNAKNSKGQVVDPFGIVKVSEVTIAYLDKAIFDTSKAAVEAQERAAYDHLHTKKQPTTNSKNTNPTTLSPQIEKRGKEIINFACNALIDNRDNINTNLVQDYAKKCGYTEAYDIKAKGNFYEVTVKPQNGLFFKYPNAKLYNIISDCGVDLKTLIKYNKETVLQILEADKFNPNDDKAAFGGQKVPSGTTFKIPIESLHLDSFGPAGRIGRSMFVETNLGGHDQKYFSTEEYLDRVLEE